MLSRWHPTCVRNMLLFSPHEVMIQLGKCFQRICVKVMDLGDITTLKLFVTKMLCMLEM